jgi:4-deoxy-L-threo-5-hexosulose-uronate ketol-isomerase
MKRMETRELREAFLMPELLLNGEIRFTYSHYDRMIVGGAVPTQNSISLDTYEPLKAEFFLQRREMGIINIGGMGTVTADGIAYALNKLDCLYLAKGTKAVSFASTEAGEPAKFYVLSAPAHHTYPNMLMKSSDAVPVALGSTVTSNERTIYKYIHEDGIKSCQLVMGLTILKTGSVWNTMPSHTHNRRMEAYLYFDLEADQRVFHLMGTPQETRHLVVANEEAILSPPWSIHSGCGTASYSFIWGMAGENQAFTDMDAIAINELL